MSAPMSYAALSPLCSAFPQWFCFTCCPVAKDTGISVAPHSINAFLRPPHPIFFWGVQMHTHILTPLSWMSLGWARNFSSTEGLLKWLPQWDPSSNHLPALRWQIKTKIPWGLTAPLIPPVMLRCRRNPTMRKSSHINLCDKSSARLLSPLSLTHVLWLFSFFAF